MRSDFTAARELLEQAHSLLGGSDGRSIMLREALDLMVEAVLTAEHSQASEDNVVPFPRRHAS